MFNQQGFSEITILFTAVNTDKSKISFSLFQFLTKFLLKFFIFAILLFD